MAENKLIAKGTFEVEMKPVKQDKVGDITVGQYAFEKKFQGDMEATSKVDMLAIGSDSGSGTYVALEQVNGTLHGKSGTFALTHIGNRNKTSAELTVTIVPGCSTGELAGLEGKMTISIIEKKHFYEMEYSFV